MRDSRAGGAEGSLKLFLGVGNLSNNNVEVAKGELAVSDNEMIIGGEEATMMIDEGLIKGQGDAIAKFPIN